MPYTPFTWADNVGGATPIIAPRLNAIEAGIAGTTADLRAALMGQMIAPPGALGVTMPRSSVSSSSLAPLFSGRLSLTLIYLHAGDVITSVSWASGSTAGAGLTNRWAALFDASRVLLRQSTTDTTATWSTLTAQTYTLTSTYTVPTSGLYYVGLMVAGTTVPSVLGNTATLQGGVNAVAPIAHGGSDTGLTTTAPSTAAALTATSGTPWVWVS